MATLNTVRLNEAFEVLTHPYRRYVVYHLTNESAVVDVDALTGAIVEWDGGHVESDRSTRRQHVETALRHTHLPKLDAAGVVSLAGDGEQVELEDADGIDQFIEHAAPVDGYEQFASSD